MSAKSKRGDEVLLSGLETALDRQDARELAEAIRAGLTRGGFAVVMRAAEIAEGRELGDAMPDLETAFARLLPLAPAKDPGCLAKLAVAKAMRAIGNADHDLLLRGARHIQMEPVWGGSVDTAGNLRGLCVTALVEGGYPGAMFEAVQLLADPAPEARRHAVQAVAAAGGAESELLLRMKALHGDQENGIVADAIAALVRINPARSLDFAAGFLDSPSPVIREETALALGESHLPGALPLLRAAWEKGTRQQAASKLLLAIALHRSDEAFAFLTEIVAAEAHASALEALDALAVFRHDPARWQQVALAVKRRGDKRLAARLQEIS